MIPNTGKLSIPVADHRDGDGYTTISEPKQGGKRYCFRSEIADALINKGWIKIHDLNELPF